MRIYKVVKKEENPTIPLSKVNMEDGFLIAMADGEAIGIIVYDANNAQYIMITDFWDDFSSGIDPRYYNEDLEKLMEEIKSDYTDLVEFNFVRVER
jgi:hypothetical protein